jgi:hypothetical protein
MAQQEGLRYFHGRWVGVAEHIVLRKEQAIISGITFMWILSVVCREAPPPGWF